LSGVESITNDADNDAIVLRTWHGGALRLRVIADELFGDGLGTTD
jgi:hypothetical protein